MMKSRFQTLTRKCNGKWATVDTPCTLILECVFQVLVRRTVVVQDDASAKLKQHLKDKYLELFGLPLVVYTHSPSRFSIAQRIRKYTHVCHWCSG